MEHKIIRKEKNPFLGREEFLIEIKSTLNPVEEDIKKMVGKDPELAIVKKITNNFGRHNFSADVIVYESAEAKQRVETVPKKVRKQMEEDKKKAEEAAKANQGGAQ